MREILRSVVCFVVALSVSLVGNGAKTGVNTAYGAWTMHNYTTASKAGSTNKYWQSKGGWGVAGGVYGQFTCATCHRPDAANIKGIQGKFTSGKAGQGFPGKTVVYQNATSMGSMTEAGRTSSLRVCEACHTQTKHHRYNVTADYSTWNGGGGNGTATQTDTTPHYYGATQDCVSCHAHNKGFIASCTSCHGTPPTTTAIGGPSGLANPATNALGTSPANPGAHNAHYNTMGITCDACHKNNLSSGHDTTSVLMGFYLNGTTWSRLKNPITTFSTYTGNNTTAGYTAKPAGNSYPTSTIVGNKASTDNSCNTYCHANWANGGGTVVRPRWAVPTDGACGTCHFIQGTVAASGATGNHSKHAAAAGSGNYGFKCATCHNSVADTTQHVQGQVTISFDNLTTPVVGSSASASYRGTAALQPATATSASFAGITGNYGACTNLYCHSDGKGTSAPNYPTGAAAPSWGAAAMTCTSCHGNGAGTNPTGTTDLSGAHGSHVNNSALIGYNYTCNECHAATAVSNSALVTNPAVTHVTGQVNYSSSTYTMGGTSIRRAGSKAVFAYTAGYNTCTSYCHTTGKKGIVPAGAEPAVPAWNTTFTNPCKGCHGAMTGIGSFASKFGEPNYSTARVPGAPNANSHKKHVNVANDCYNCHRKTTVSGTAVLANYSGHLDGNVDARFARPNGFGNMSGAYNITNKTCSSTYCHGATSTPQWGGLSLTCNACHGAAPGNSTGNDRYWNAYSSAHKQHVEVTTLPTAYYGVTPANNSSAALYNFACTSCHSDTRGASHANGMVSANQAAQVFFGFTTAGKSGSYTAGTVRGTKDNGFLWTAGTCTTTYCHSDGNGGGPKVSTFNWGTKNNTLRCYACHGAQDIKTGATQSSMTNYSSIRTNAHARHVRPDINTELGYGNGLDCYRCHAATVTAAMNSYSTVSANVLIKNRHVNKMRDYSSATSNPNGGTASVGQFNASAHTCSNVYCHSNSKVGTAVGQYADPAAWNSGTANMKCNYCHGRQTVSKDTDATLALYSSTGVPNYLNTGTVGSATSNSHRKHVAALGTTDYSNTQLCYNCHSATLDSTTGRAGTAAKFRAYSSRHTNGSYNIKMKASLGATIYNGAIGTKSCSNVVCHGGTSSTPKWGETSNCDYCHPRATLSGAHQYHIDATAALPTVYLNLTGNKSAGSKYNYGCSICHPLNNSGHANGTIVIDFRQALANGGSLRAKNATGVNAQATAVKGAAYSGTQATTGISGTAGTSVICNNVYCHSNGGNSGGTVLTTTTYYASPDWYGTITAAQDKCSMCHGNMPNSTGSFGARTGSPAHYNNTWLGYANVSSGHSLGFHDKNIYKGGNLTGLVGKTSGAPSAHGNPALVTTFNCNVCHNLTVTTTANDKNNVCVACHKSGNTAGALAHNPGGFGQTTDMQLIANTAYHVNGTLNITFRNMTSYLIPAQVRDASYPNYSSSWRRVNGYKATTGSSERWNPKKVPSYSAGSCSNIACHNGQTVNWSGTGGTTTCQSCHTDL